MLHLFRTIRRKLFSEGKIVNYLGYALGEIVLIVVGILLALQISDWNQGRKDGAEEQEILLRLRGEFEVNQNALEESQRNWNDVLSAMKELLKIVGPEPEEYPDESIHVMMSRLTWIPDYLPNTGVLNSLIASGDIKLIRNKQLNFNLNSWPARVERYDYFVSHLRDVRSFMYSLLSHYQFRDALIGGERYGLPDHSGPSHFSYDQNKLLSLPMLENAAEMKRLDTESVLGSIRELSLLQQEILGLIDKELVRRN